MILKHFKNNYLKNNEKMEKLFIINDSAENKYVSGGTGKKKTKHTSKIKKAALYTKKEAKEIIRKIKNKNFLLKEIRNNLCETFFEKILNLLFSKKCKYCGSSRVFTYTYYSGPGLEERMCGFKEICHRCQRTNHSWRP